jgi:hypothetical protein
MSHTLGRATLPSQVGGRDEGDYDRERCLGEWRRAPGGVRRECDGTRVNLEGNSETAGGSRGADVIVGGEARRGWTVEERSLALRGVQDLRRIGRIGLADLVRVHDGVDRVGPLRSRATPAGEPLLLGRATGDPCREGEQRQNGERNREEPVWSRRHVGDQ